MQATDFGQWKTARVDVTAAQKAAWANLDIDDPPEPWQMIAPAPDVPEKRLLRELLDLTLQDLCPSPKSVRRGRFLRWQQAAGWIASDEEHEGAFSFIHVCHCLDIEPEFLRRLVSAYRCTRCGQGIYATPCRCVHE